MVCKTRFAPSPTGMLHVGNVRTALINWLLTKALNGVFTLRLDDTDLLRSKKEYEEQIKTDLLWLGINWDDSFRQSDRLSRYQEVKDNLLKIGRLYPCFETQNELDLKRKLLINKGHPPLYDRASLKLTKEEIEQKIAAGFKPHYRFLLDHDQDINWHDLIRGEINFKAKNLNDPIVIREDGSMTYILCSSIDDVDSAITHVLRGEDHISNTAIGVQITKALGAEPPVFGHLSLLHSKTGEISKRVGGFDIQALRANGIHPMAINSWLAKVGTSDSVEPFSSLNDLVTNFKLENFSQAAVNYDYQEIVNLNHKIMLHLDYHLAAKFIKDSGFHLDISPEFWQVIKKNLHTLTDLEQWQQICFTDLIFTNIDEDREFLKIAATLLPENDWNDRTWDAWLEKIKAVSERTGKKLFKPIRNALTGKEDGPELKYILPFIGFARTKQRLNA